MLIDYLFRNFACLTNLQRGYINDCGIKLKNFKSWFTRKRGNIMLKNIAIQHVTKGSYNSENNNRIWPKFRQILLVKSLQCGTKYRRCELQHEQSIVNIRFQPYQIRFPLLEVCNSLSCLYCYKMKYYRLLQTSVSFLWFFEPILY